MKEGITPYPGRVFKETFRDEYHVRRNGGVPSNVTFENGTAIFVSGSSSKIVYAGIWNTRSVRFVLIDVTSFYCKLASGRTVTIAGGTLSSTGFSSATYYVNGSVGTSVSTTGKVEIVVYDNADFTVNDLQVGYDGASYGTFTCDLGELFNRALTASEVANFYNDRWNVKLTDTTGITTLSDYQSIRGFSEDKFNTLTETSMDYPRIGNSWAALFDGANSKIDMGSDFVGTKAITIMCWINPYSLGEGDYGRMLTNKELSPNDGFNFLLSVGNRLRFESDNTSYAVSASNSITLNKKQFVAVTREADGIVNFYTDYRDLPPSRSGSANQNSGTPVAGTTNVILGNNNNKTRTFDGLIKKMKVVEGILSIDEITQYWSSTLKSI